MTLKFYKRKINFLSLKVLMLENDKKIFQVYLLFSKTKGSILRNNSQILYSFVTRQTEKELTDS